MRKFAGVMIALVLCVPFISWTATRAVQKVVFTRNVEGHLKRAADANTIELAKKELSYVVTYLEENKMTSGYTSVWWTTPDEDVGFWYTNLVASLNELRLVKSDATQLEKSNVLIKLRETLVDNGNEVTVTVPEGASIFPHNMFFFWWGWGGFLIGAFGVILGLIVAVGE